MKYQKPDPIASLREDFPVGIHVVNFGFEGVVIGYHVVDKLLIVRDVRGRQKWLADPEKCAIPVQKPVSPGMVPILI